MADRLMRAQVVIPLDSNIPEDAIVNTLYFDQDDNGLLPPPDDSYDAVVASLAQFYNAFDNTIFPSTVATSATVRIYDMRDPEPRQMRRLDAFAIVPSGQAPLPNEVACCASFAADYESGVNPARRRGRVYLGPISSGVVEVLNSQAMITQAAVDAIIAGLDSLLAPNDVGGSSLTWALYSPTTDAGGANIDDSFFDVQRGWVDNAFDTQRRRGAAPTIRTTTD